MKTIHYYGIVLSVYHGTPVGRLRFEDNGEIEESGLYTPKEMTNIICLWKQGDLLGSFGIGTILAKDAGFILCEM